MTAEVSTTAFPSARELALPAYERPSGVHPPLDFAGDEQTANAADPVLCSITEPARRATLIAVPEPEGELRFDIWLQGERETVFFDV